MVKDQTRLRQKVIRQFSF